MAVQPVHGPVRLREHRFARKVPASWLVTYSIRLRVRACPRTRIPVAPHWKRPGRCPPSPLEQDSTEWLVWSNQVSHRIGSRCSARPTGGRHHRYIVWWAML
jgi:hypothetical protein